jgi:general secretion pathway protein N
VIGQRALLLAAAVVASLTIVVATAPARLVALLVEPESLLLSGFHGTVWNGSAARAALATPAGPLQLGGVRWTLQPLSLLTLSPRVEIDARWGRQHLAMRVQTRADGLELHDVDAALDARLVSQFAPVALRGRVEMQFSELQIAAGLLVNVKGRALWRDAAWLGPNGVKALGSHVATLQTSGDGSIAVAIETLSGPVRAQGAVNLRGRAYVLDVTIDAGAGLDRELEQALSLVAVPTKNGYRLRLDGALPAPE